MVKVSSSVKKRRRGGRRGERGEEMRRKKGKMNVRRQKPIKGKQMEGKGDKVRERVKGEGEKEQGKENN